MKIKVLDPKCEPYKAHDSDAGIDLRAKINIQKLIHPGSTIKIPLGIAIQIPQGWVGDLRPRSGLAEKGISPVYGTIDAGYRGELHAALLNHSNGVEAIEPYERIAQLVVVRCRTDWNKVGKDVNLMPSQRGDQGFGSTGRF